MNRKNNDIAVIGMAGKFPGANSVAQFWENICAGKESIRSLSDDELRNAGVPEADIHDSNYVKVAPTLDDIDMFDAPFFKISPAEAQLVDPQLRLFLQCAWETLEDAGLASNEAQNIGLFAGSGGIVTSYYSNFVNQNSNIEKVTASATQLGNDKDFLATYISYKLNLTGPSITVQTACSTSLVALHLACSSVINEECAMAMAGGVSVRIPHVTGYHHKEGHIVSKSGHVKTFDESADGAIFGSGMGLVLVKRLDQAIADGNNIYVTIKGSSVSNDGKGKLSYAASSARGQIKCIRDALKRADVDAGSIGFVETHGTGTNMGDPEEVKALSSAFKKQTDKKGYCALGAVKTNVGHLEAASGITAFIKAALVLHHGFIPPTLHFNKPNPRIKFEKTPFFVNNALQQWPQSDQPRRAGVNSLGVGGTNAFMVLEEYIADDNNAKAPLVLADDGTVLSGEGGPVVVPISAKDKAGLHRLVMKLADFTATVNDAKPWVRRDINLLDLSYTLQVGREPMDHRVAFVVRSLEELQECLDAWIAADKLTHIVQPKAHEKDSSAYLYYSDEEAEEAIAGFIKEQKWAELAQIWTDGVDFYWQDLYADYTPKRISLPTYAFAKERYWIETGHLVETCSQLHPLLHSNTSNLNLQNYSSVFSGAEFFLKDHQVNIGSHQVESVLPGVAYLEMARAAVEKASFNPLPATTMVLHDVVWLQPIIITEPTEVSIALFPHEGANGQGNSDQVDYEVYSQYTDEEGELQDILHCQGQASYGDAAPAAHINIAELKAKMDQGRLRSNAIYPALAKMGLEYGPGFQGITTIYQGEDQLLAEINLPASVMASRGDFVFHPSLLDCALQSTNALVVDLNNPPENPLVPFALESVQLLAPCSKQVFAWVRYSAGSQAQNKLIKLDIELYDDSGKLCVQMKGFTARMLGKDAQPAAAFSRPTGNLLATPVWQPGPAAELPVSDEPVRQHVILCDLPDIDSDKLAALLPDGVCHLFTLESPEDFAHNYSNLATMCFDTIKTVMQSKPKTKQLIQVVTPYLKNHAFCAGLSGLFKSAALENPQLSGHVILVESHVTHERLANKLIENRHAGHDSVIKYEQGLREVFDWQEIPASLDNPPKFTAEQSLYNDHGVYLITGGLGGLGLLFAKEILSQTSGCKIILTGRASEISADKQALLAGLNEGNSGNSSQSRGAVEYRALDLANLAQMTTLIADIKQQYQQLNGVIHSAGMNADNFILNKSTDEFRQVLMPKVVGTYNLDQATKDTDLDFMVLFSSLTSVLGNLGQADYAAANGFLDRFSSYRDSMVERGERRGQTLAINWALWQDGGMGQDQASIDILRDTTGIAPMQTATGMTALYRSIALKLQQTVVMEGDLSHIERTLFAAPVMAEEESSLAQVGQAFIEGLLEKTEEYLCKELSGLLKMPAHKIDPQAPMEQYGIDSILAIDLTNKLEKTFGALSKTLFFEYQTIRELTDYFINAHSAQLGGLFAAGNSSQTAFKTGSVSGSVSGTVPIAMPDSEQGSRRSRSRRHYANTGSQTSGAHGTTGNTRVAANHEQIAIIGLSGRYPQASNVEEYWQNLRDGKDCITAIPEDRWKWQDYYSEDRTLEGHHFSKWGGFIEGVDEFDPRFFNISPREAETIDPQERIFLQHAWMAVEDAGYTRETLQIPYEQDLPGQVGVYVGVMYGEYQLLGVKASAQGKRMGISSNLASIANRVSYVLNLHGPSMTIDTMCSSSITTIHIACQDLKQGQTSLAIAGGVNVTIDANKYLMLSAGQFISSDGHCQSFGEGGDGYIPAEGVGAVVLKRLSEAKRDGHHIYGIIRGSSLSHGGKTNGYTVPNPQAQASAVSRALTEANLDPRHISYIEAHGTGTKLGDPIEIAALNKAFYRTVDDQGKVSTVANKEFGFCDIGSAKSNIGHAESAAGIAGLTKVLLQMKHQKIVPSLHSTALNPHIDFAKSPFVVNQTLKNWDQPEINGEKIPRIAGLSSFGAGGANAHILIEEYVPPAPVVQTNELLEQNNQAIIALSARTVDQLRQKAVDLLNFILLSKEELGKEEASKPLNLRAMAYTLQVGREAMGERLGFIATSVADLADKLQAFTNGERDIEDVFQGQVKANKDSMSLISQDDDMIEAIEKWITRKKLPKLVDLWVKGLSLDWHKLYGDDKPLFISLPTYPFAKQRFWIDVEPDSLMSGGTAALHPLLHSNTSDLNSHSYRSTFGGDEAFLVSSGLAGEQKLLSAGAYLEMARAGMEQASDVLESSILELHNTAWGEPFVFSADNAVSLALFSTNNDQVDFEIYSKDTVHCQGQAVYSQQPAPASFDIAQLRSQVGEGQSLTELSLGTDAPDNSAYILHPGVMSGVFDAALTLSGHGAHEGSSDVALPFALQSMRIIFACSGEMFAWVRTADVQHANTITVDIDLINQQGHVCVQMRGLSYQLEAVAAPVVQIAETVAAVAPAATPIFAKPNTVALATPVARAPALATTAPAGPMKISLGLATASVASTKPAVFKAAVKSPITLATPGNAKIVATAVTAAPITLVELAPSVEMPKVVSIARVSQPKPTGITLATPGIKALVKSAPRGTITLASTTAVAATSAAPAAELVSLHDNGNGLFALQILAHEGVSGELSDDLIDQLLLAFKAAKQASSLKVLTISSATQTFLSGGREQINAAISAKLYQTIAAFPYPVIALMQGDATGAGFLVGALCDFMICSESATYAFAQATATEDLLLRHRFGDVQAYDFLYLSKSSTGNDLKTKAWTCPIVAADQVMARGDKLAKALADKSQDALRLLTQHLARHILDAANALSVSVEAKSGIDRKDKPKDAPKSPAKHISLTSHSDKVLLLNIGVPKTRYGVKALLGHLSTIFAQLEASSFSTLVINSDYDTFLPPAGQKVADDIVLGLQTLLLDAAIPVIVALKSDAKDLAWFISQYADACVYNEQASYSFNNASNNAANIWQSDAVAQHAAMIFAHRFGGNVAKQILLSGADYTGAELQRDSGALLVAPAQQVLATALTLADSWAESNLDTLTSWKSHNSALINDTFKQLPVWSLNGNQEKQDSFAPVADVTEVALKSAVISATAYPDGVVVVTMADKNAKNMFSEAFTAGMNEVFAHIETTPAYKVVVLTGYDSYFAAGGNKAMLLAIQQGSVKFTDNKVFQSAAKCSLPVIGAVQGHGIGAGWVLGMNADLIILSEQSKFVSPYMGYNFTPGAGSTHVFPQRVGYDLARETLLLAQENAGHELKDRGLLLPVLPRKDVLPAALALAKQVAQGSRSRLMALKHQWNQPLLPKLEETYTIELDMHEKTFVGDSDTLAQIESSFDDAEAKSAGQVAPVVTATATPVARPVVQATAAVAVDLDLTTVSNMLRSLLAQELRMDEEEIDDDNQFVDLGLDSITGVTWIRNINQEYGTNIEAIKVYSYPTLNELSRYVKEEAQGLAAAPAPVAVVAAPTPAAVVLAPVVAAPVAVVTAPVTSTITSTEVRAAHSIESISALLKGLLAEELRMDTDEIDEDMQFVDLGLDSITGVTWMRKVNDNYGTNIEAIKVYSYPTLTELSRYVKEEADALGGGVEGISVEAAPVAAVVAPVVATPIFNQPVVAPVAAPVVTRTTSSVAVDNLPAVNAKLKTLLADELRMDEDEIDEDMQFVDLGLDSITGVTWIRKINDEYGTNIEAIKVYSYPTLNELVRYVRDEAQQQGSLTVEMVETVVEGIVEAPVAIAVATPAPAPITTTRATSSRFVVKPLTSWRSASGQKRKTSHSPQIAVIGMAGQFPQANNLDEYWQNIAGGKNCITQIAADRWDLDTYYQEGKPTPGKTNSQWMGALAQYDQFDPLFFNISPKEAKSMDPQQRMFLQTCWGGIENAGYNPRDLSGTKTGVFVGCATGDYHQFSAKHQLSALGFTGGESSILAARISYFLNLTGPCLSINTACSSSLVAIANACESLNAGASDIALAGGVNVMAGPAMHIKSAQAGMLSTDGRCFTFDSRANGFVPGEGVGVVMLKRLADAQRDGDSVVGVIEGWGVNQDGKTNGITAPNADSQTRLQQDVFDQFNINPANIQLIEAHGTGTSLGDPIEVSGLKAAFKSHLAADSKGGVPASHCALGSVKSNIGHCLTAAGVSGVIKVLLAVKHQQLPPTINFEKLNPHISLENSPFYINKKLQDWPVAANQPRQAAVSSFGFGGTNAYVVLSEYQAPVTLAALSVQEAVQQSVIIPLSARTPEQLKQKAVDLLGALKGEKNLNDIAYTLQVGREAMTERLGFIVNSVDQLSDRLTAYINGEKRIKDSYKGQMQGKSDSLYALSSDADFQQTVAKWMSSGKQVKLIDLWAKGLSLDWSKLYNHLPTGVAKPKRIGLPTYPFAQERHWLNETGLEGAVEGLVEGVVEKEAEQIVVPAQTAAAVLHPLLHANTSDLSQQSYSSTFSGQEFFLADHQKVLPAVAYLEMARVAVAKAMPAAQHGDILQLHNIAWAQPVVANQQTQVSIALVANGADQVDYEVYSEANGSGEVIHHQGSAIFSNEAKPNPLNLAQLQSQMQRGMVDTANLYNTFSAQGLNYGPSYQGLTAIEQGDNQLLAQVSLPASAKGSFADYILHPSMMDSALQAAMTLGGLDSMSNAVSGLVPQQLSFSLTSLHIISACTEQMVAWVRYAHDGVGMDIDLCDPQGNVCVQMMGLSLQDAVPAPAPVPAPLPTPVNPTLQGGGISLSAPSSFTPVSKPAAVSLKAVSAMTDMSQIEQAISQSLASLEVVASAATPSTATLSKAQLQQQLTASLAEALYMKIADIGLEKPFIDLGLDSIVGVEWVSEINKQYGTEMSATRVYDYPNIKELAAFLQGELSIATPVASAPAPVVALAPVAAPAKKGGLSQAALQQQLIVSLAEALYMKVSDIGLEKPFIDLGLDSIVGVEWVSEINKQYGTEISATRVYDYPNVKELAAYLHGQINNTVMLSERDEAPAAVMTLSIEDLMAELAAEADEQTTVKKPQARAKKARVKVMLAENKGGNKAAVATVSLADLTTAKPIKKKVAKKAKPAAVALKTLSPVKASAAKATFSKAQLQQQLTESLAEALYMKVSDIGLEKPFIDLGLDSIVGVEWVSELNKQYGTELSATRVYDYPNVKELAAYLHGLMAKTKPAAAPVVLAAPAPLKPIQLSVPAPVLIPAKKAAAALSTAQLQQQLTASLAEALYMKVSDIGLEKPFIDLGLDSIVGVEWVSEINKQYGTDISATRVYDYPNIKELAVYLHGQMGTVEVAAAPVLAPLKAAPAAPSALSTTPALSQAELQQQLIASLAEALYMKIADIGLEKPFIDLGLDSIVGVEWVSEINKQYGTEISATRVYDYPNIKELATYLLTQMAVSAPSAPVLAPVPAPTVQLKPAALVAAQPRTAQPRAMQPRAARTAQAAPVQRAAAPRLAARTVQPRSSIRGQAASRVAAPPVAACAIEFEPKFDAKHTEQYLYSPRCQGNFADDGEVAILYTISPQTNIGLKEHVIFGEHLLPTDVYIELVYSACTTWFSAQQPSLNNITIMNPLLGSNQQPNHLKVIFRKVDSGLQFFVKSSFSDTFSDEKLHMQGFITADSLSHLQGPAVSQYLSHSDLQLEIELTGADIVTNNGVYYAPLQKIACGAEAAMGYIQIADNDFNFAINSLAIYAGLGTVINFGAYQVNKQYPVADELFLPYTIDNLSVFGDLNHSVYCYAQTKKVSQDSVELYFELLDSQMKPLLIIQTIRLQRVSQATIAQQVQAIKNALATTPIATPVSRNVVPAASQDVAVIGMSCVYPMSDSVDEFWHNLTTSKDCVIEVPADRWLGHGDWYHPDQHNPGTSFSKWCGFVNDIDAFDPLFFGISPADAEVMEPQQRIFLEQCWKTIESAGYAPRALAHERCGVYIGCAASDYSKVLASAGLDGVGASFMGTSTAILAARISYYLNLKGPALALDTACSSSLTAMHLACESIRHGENELALAGGVNILATPFGHVLTSQVGMLSKEGRCAAFDAAASGIVFSEGCGVILLKSLARAMDENDNILGIIKGSGTNQDGKTNGITAPSSNAQEKLLNQVYQQFNINPADISYVEAHGTGTPLGDPIEVNALSAVFKQYSAQNNYCALGSVKTNIGHCGFASGMAGVIKVLLSLKHKQLAPSIHYNKPNPHINFADSPFYVNTECQPWQSKGPRLATISSFGFSGTNAHIVIGEHVAAAPVASHQVEVLLPLSAKTAQELQQQARDLTAFISKEPTVDLSQMAYTLQVGRDSMDYRVTFMVSSVEQLTEKLAAFMAGKPTIRDVCQGRAQDNREAMMVFETDQDMQGVIGNWLADKKLAKLADLWVKGLDLEWDKLYVGSDRSNAQRLALPTYPFARERYWAEGAQKVENKATAAKLHPLVHRNTSDFNQQSYSSVFDGSEYFLRDHQVKTDKVLPAVAYLEMVRQAIFEAMADGDSNISIQNVAWMQPVVVSAATEISIALSLADDESAGERISFEVYSQTDDQEVIHCQGQAIITSSPEALCWDINQLQAQMTQGRVEASSLYTKFSQMGLNYGPAYQGIHAIVQGNDQLLVELNLPASAQQDEASYVLHPCMMDSALQGSIALIAGSSNQTALPFALESVIIHNPCCRQMLAWVRYSLDNRSSGNRSSGNRASLIKVDIDLIDSQGNVCVQMQGFSSRPLEASPVLARETWAQSEIANQSKIIDTAGHTDNNVPFDDAFYKDIIARVSNNVITADQAGELEQ